MGNESTTLIRLNSYEECISALTGISSVLFGTTEDGDEVVVTAERINGELVVKRSVFQRNGWVRDEWIHENGTVEEMYSR